jgi:hypothetical protein
MAMAPARAPQHRSASSSPDAAAAAPDATARPDDVDRAWAFLARNTAWEQRLAELRLRAGPVTPLGVVVPAGAESAAGRSEAA